MRTDIRAKEANVRDAIWIPLLENVFLYRLYRASSATFVLAFSGGVITRSVILASR